MLNKLVAIDFQYFYFPDLRELQEIVSFLAQRDALPEKADLLIVFGSSDLNVPLGAAKLYHTGIVDRMLICGGYGRTTADLVSPESVIYQQKLIAAGVPEDRIILEKNSSNMTENIVLGLRLLEWENIQPQKVILMHNPLLQRRAGLTFQRIMKSEAFWKMETYNYAAYLPEITDFQEYMLYKEQIGGEIERLQKYGSNGLKFIIDPVWPAEVLAAGDKLGLAVFANEPSGYRP